MTLAQETYETNKAARPVIRQYWTVGDLHIDRVCKEILLGVPGRDPAIRLQAAALFKEVLDHHPNCYQRTGVPADLPANLCDCRVLRMLDKEKR